MTKTETSKAKSYRKATAFCKGCSSKRTKLKLSFNRQHAALVGQLMVLTERLIDLELFLRFKDPDITSGPHPVMDEEELTPGRTLGVPESDRQASLPIRMTGPGVSSSSSIQGPSAQTTIDQFAHDGHKMYEDDSGLICLDCDLRLYRHEGNPHG